MWFHWWVILNVLDRFSKKKWQQLKLSLKGPKIRNRPWPSLYHRTFWLCLQFFLDNIAELQNSGHWKGPLEIISSSILLFQLEKVAQEHLSFEYFQTGRFHSLSEQPVSLHGHRHNEKWFMFRWNFMGFSLILFLSLGTPEKRPGPFFAQLCTYIYILHMIYIYFSQPYTTVTQRFRSISHHFERWLLPVY